MEINIYHRVTEFLLCKYAIDKNRVPVMYICHRVGPIRVRAYTYHDDRPSSNRVMTTYVYYGEKCPSVTRPEPHTWNDIKQR